jgi:hypothetical protein
MNLFCWKTCHRTCLSYLNPVLPSCLKNGLEKNLFREICLDSYGIKKPVHQPVFCGQISRPDCNKIKDKKKYVINLKKQNEEERKKLLPGAGWKVGDDLVDRTNLVAVEFVAHFALHFQGDLVRIVDAHLLRQSHLRRHRSARRLGQIDLQLFRHGGEERKVGNFVRQRVIRDSHVDSQNRSVDLKYKSAFIAF